MKTEPLTMYKNNSRDSSKFKGCSPLQLSCNLTGKCHAVGYYSYTLRCGQCPAGRKNAANGRSPFPHCPQRPLLIAPFAHGENKIK